MVFGCILHVLGVWFVVEYNERRCRNEGIPIIINDEVLEQASRGRREGNKYST